MPISERVVPLSPPLFRSMVGETTSAVMAPLRHLARSVPAANQQAASRRAAECTVSGMVIVPKRASVPRNRTLVRMSELDRILGGAS
jgi:hypothetical protein